MQDQVREPDIHLLDYWRVLVKRRWVVYTAVVVVVSVTALGSFLKTPIYTATVRVQIEPSTPNILPFQEIAATVPDLRNDFYQTQYGLIQSRRIAREVIASLGLAGLEEFRVKGGWNPGASGPAAEVRRVDLFLKKLKVSPVRNSRLVDVSFASFDPELAAKAANRAAETYIAFNSEARYNTTERATASLSHQIANLQEEIDAKEKELQAYARQHEIVALNEKQNVALKTLNDLSNACTQAQAVRIEKEARYAALKDTRPESIPEVLESELIQGLTAKSAELGRRYAQLSEKYKPDWPEMVRLRKEMDETSRRLQSEREAIYGQVLGAAEGAYRAARNEERFLEKAVQRQKRETQELAVKEIRYRNLMADVANRRATLEALAKRQTEASSSVGLNDVVAGNIRIVDAAEVPVRPSSPRVKLNILLSIFAGFGLGLGLAFFFEYLDKSVKTLEEMHQATGVPAIGLIPALRTETARLHVVKGDAAAAPAHGPMELVTHAEPKAKVSEAFRELRTALLVSQAGGPPRTILVTSTYPGEGKTALALNLAISLAQLSRRVLLVDADLRKPRLHRLLNVPSGQGLSAYLSAAGTPWPEPVATPIAGLHLVPSGPLPPNAADLLDSERFGQLLAEFDAQGYEHVVFDSPPVLAVADPAIMAVRMSAVLVVVQAGVTGRDALQHAVRRLQQVKARLVGCVLNRFDLDQQSAYYGYYYRRYYGEEPGEEQPAVESVTPRKRGRTGGKPEPRAEA